MILANLSINNINDQLSNLKEYVLEILHNKTFFATPFQNIDKERKNLEEEIVAKVNQIQNNYDPDSPMHRNFKHLTEGKISVKETPTPFSEENKITPRDILKLEEWPKFTGDREYNYIELIRKIYILQEDFHIPDGIIVAELHSLFTITLNKLYYKIRK
ncbi:hypothetical protein O181_064066 [Austropuccinia psidii MF-1]|uniref:Uncharacterized protein n=1 Tax=Austropuccinia psidii MF-1 TaxID=1389203 RepID=A0A9Q3HZY4_9BASI|nr:hypothetical protein [Austropuccinia psidii MF-1]